MRAVYFVIVSMLIIGAVDAETVIDDGINPTDGLQAGGEINNVIDEPIFDNNVTDGLGGDIGDINVTDGSTTPDNNVTDELLSDTEETNTSGNPQSFPEPQAIGFVFPDPFGLISFSEFPQQSIIPSDIIDNQQFHAIDLEGSLPPVDEEAYEFAFNGSGAFEPICIQEFPSVATPSNHIGNQQLCITDLDEALASVDKEVYESDFTNSFEPVSFVEIPSVVVPSNHIENQQLCIADLEEALNENAIYPWETIDAQFNIPSMND